MTAGSVESPQIMQSELENVTRPSNRRIRGWGKINGCFALVLVALFGQLLELVRAKS